MAQIKLQEKQMQMERGKMWYWKMFDWKLLWQILSIQQRPTVKPVKHNQQILRKDKASEGCISARKTRAVLSAGSSLARWHCLSCSLLFHMISSALAFLLIQGFDVYHRHISCSPSACLHLRWLWTIKTLTCHLKSPVIWLCIDIFY